MSSTTVADPSEGALAGRTAFITGASRGIGAECARLLHAAGARLVLVGRDSAALEKLTQSMAGTGASVRVEQADLGDSAAVARLVPAVTRAFGDAPDIIINNAGHFFLAAAEETSLEDFARTLQVNVTAPFAIVRALLPELKQRKRGHIVTIGSIADHAAFPGNAAYAASKYGVRGLHEVLRQELRGTGVRATLISPGPTNTDLWDLVNPDEREGFTKRADMLPPSAVAEAVLYAVTSPANVNVDELRISRA